MGRFCSQLRKGSASTPAAEPALPPDPVCSITNITINAMGVYLSLSWVFTVESAHARAYLSAGGVRGDLAHDWGQVVVNDEDEVCSIEPNPLPSGTYQVSLQRPGFAEIFSPEEEW